MGSTIESETRARKAWKAKYGHQFEMPDSAPNSRPGTGMSQAPPKTAQSRASSRPASNASAATHEKRQKLIDLKKKLMSALEEVDGELQATSDFGSKSRSSTRMQ